MAQAQFEALILGYLWSFVLLRSPFYCSVRSERIGAGRVIKPFPLHFKKHFLYFGWHKRNKGKVWVKEYKNGLYYLTITERGLVDQQQIIMH